MSAGIRDTDVFARRGGILLANLLLDGKPADIMIGDDGRITAAGEGVRHTFRGEAEFVVDCNGGHAIPGLVNTHTHAAMTLLRGYADDLPLQEWLQGKIWPLETHLTGDDVYWGTRLACLEMIHSGTTAFNDMYFFMEEAARAVADSGIRACLSYGFIDLGDADRRERECRATERFVATVGRMQNGRIQAAVGPHAVYTVSPQGLRWAGEFAREKGLRIHVHLSETEQEVHDCIAQHGARPPALLERCGCLTPVTIAAHCCWLSREECTLLAQKGVWVSHNPVSNMKLAVGRALPYHWLCEEKARVTLGTDGAASNNSLDLFGTMKCAALLQKYAWNTQTLAPAREVLSMATCGGAQALGIGPGTLTPGSPADLIIVNPRTACNTPLHSLPSNLVYSCNGGAVETVLCDGRMLMLEHTIPAEQEILDGATQAASRLLDRARDTGP
jgi:5-methylthioadenosine/S-adenosylhomocysteine deaminase